MSDKIEYPDWSPATIKAWTPNPLMEEIAKEYRRNRRAELRAILNGDSNIAAQLRLFQAWKRFKKFVKKAIKFVNW